jgi:hypothetical protein
MNIWVRLRDFGTEIYENYEGLSKNLRTESITK